MNRKYTFRGVVIALCMAFYDWHYWWPGNLGARIWMVYLTNYIPDKVPILKAAKHCAKVWKCWYRSSCLPQSPKDMYYTE